MAIADDWDFNFAAKTISHIDGVLSYDGGTGTQPAVGQMVRGNTTGALGKVLARTGNATSGTLTLTNVVGRFADNELLYILSELQFDNVANGGFRVGDTLDGVTSGATIVVHFIEYNIDGVPGHGKVFGRELIGGPFTNNEVLDIVGGTAAVALADGTGVDNDTLWDGDVAGTLATPGAVNTNNSVIIHYDGGTIAIPEDAHIADAVSTAEGYAQRVFGSTVIGSVRVVDSDTTGGAWTNNNTLRILDCVYYDALVAGRVFSVGDVVRGWTGVAATAAGRVLAVIDDGDSTGKLILANFSGTFGNTDDIQVRQSDDSYITYAEVENGQNDYLDAAVLNLPAGVRNTQRIDQGGIYGPGSLNIVRSSNALYSYAQDLYDELGQLDDDPPLDGNVRDQLYTVLNDYIIPDLSFRFLEKGSFRDSGNNNIFTNYQTVGALADIGDHGFFYSSANPTPQPDMYIEQDGAVRRSDWVEGNLDVLIKVKTSTDPYYINPAVAALGQLINDARLTVHVRPYTRTYDSNEVSQQGGIAVVALGNARDLNNTTGQYRAAFTSGTGTPFTVGEEITSADGLKRGQVTASDTGATGNCDYALKSTTQFANTDVVTGSVSGASATFGTPSNLVAGYSSDIRVMVVQRRFTGGTTTGLFVLGELVTQTGTGATGYFMEDDGGTIYIQWVSGTFNGTGLLTGGVSAATNTPSATAVFSTVPKDIGGGVGDINYTAVTSADITDANPRSVAAVYEWWKFLLRREATTGIANVGAEGFSTEGRIFRRLQPTFAEVRGASPFGSKAGALVIGAQGMFIEKFTLIADDLRNIQLIGNNGTAYDPPNLQSLRIINLFAGVRGAAYRSTGAGQTTILRNEFTVGAVGGGFNEAANSTILLAAGTRSVSPLPNDVPDSGVLRILAPDDSGNYLRFVYDSVDRTLNTFDLQQGIGQDTIGDVTGALALTATDNAHVVFIEREASGTEVSNTIQYVADIPVVAIARIKGKKPFSTAATFGASGASIGAVLANDDVVNLP